MRATVSQLSTEPEGLNRDWEALVEHVANNGSEFVLLPEMPFGPWLAATDEVDREAWRRSVTVHRRWCDRLGELGAQVVIGSRPVDHPGPRNRGFLWTARQGLQDLHDKAYLPNEPGFWEARWYERGEPNYALRRVELDGGVSVGLGTLLCTEMWFLEHARRYGRAGADLLAVPRATPSSTLDKWIAGGRAAAVVSGAYCLSAAPVSAPGDAADLGGGSWIIDPEGELLALTSADDPFVTLDIDPGVSAAAKATYPRYVPEAPEGSGAS
jgi:N-carbamoylputrescine amidase